MTQHWRPDPDTPFGATAIRRQFVGVSTKMLAESGHIRVFAFGSLISRPEPGMKALGPAMAVGYAKTFSILDPVYRGTMSAPGRTLALAPTAGGTASGVLFDASGPETRERIFQREAAVAYTPAEIEVFDPVGGGKARAIAFIADPLADGFMKEPLDARARIIGAATGAAGSNRAYFDDVLAVEEEIGLGVSTELSRLHSLM